MRGDWSVGIEPKTCKKKFQSSRMFMQLYADITNTVLNP